MNRISVCCHVCTEPFILGKKSGVTAHSIFCIGSVKGSRQNRLCNITLWSYMEKAVTFWGDIWWSWDNAQKSQCPLRRVSPSFTHTSSGQTAQEAHGESTVRTWHPPVPRPALLLGPGSWWVWLFLNWSKSWMSPNPSAHNFQHSDIPW